MGQIFKRKSNTLVQASLIAISAISSGTLVFWTVVKWSPWDTEVGEFQDQPIPFSHQHHVSGLGIDCRYCHTGVTRSAFAGMPTTHTCMTCHSQIWQDAPMLKPVRDSLAENKPLVWNRVYRLPKYVYFNHSIHVTKGIGCTSCHGQIQKMPLMSKAQPLYMKDCLECHREPEKYLRPKSEVFNVYWVTPSSQDQLEMGSKLVKEYHIPKQRLTSCNTCHR